MKLLKSISGILAIFMLGIMAGVLGTNLVIKHRIERFHEQGPPSIKPMFMKRICDRLDLTPVQKEAVGKILDDLQKQLRDIRQEFHPKIKAAFDAGFEKIREQLTESQKTRLDLLLKEMPSPFRPGRGWLRQRGWGGFHDKSMPPDDIDSNSPPQ